MSADTHGRDGDECGGEWAHYYSLTQRPAPAGSEWHLRVKVRVTSSNGAGQ